MIIWKDFVLDDFLGPILAAKSSVEISVNSDVMDDAKTANGAQGCASIQETGQGKQPARMVGRSSLEAVRNGMEAGRDERVSTLPRKVG